MSDINTLSKSSLSIPEEVLLELAEMQKRYTEIYNNYGLCGLMAGNDGTCRGVQLTGTAFIETFSEYEVADRGADQEYPEEPYAFIDGTRFFCIRRAQ
jgi:hypothetical protein